MKKYLAVILLSLVLVLSACSPSSTRTTQGLKASPNAPSASPQPDFVGGRGVMEAAPAPPTTVFLAAADKSGSDQMIVRTGNMALVVEDVAVAVDQISTMTSRLSGIVVSSNIYQQDINRLFGSISIRVPAERFDEAINALRALAAAVTNETTDSRDVTEEYTDLTSRLKNLEATETQLRAILAKAEKVEDILAVQRELNNIRGQIEQTKGRMQYLERTSATSLITISLQQAKLNAELTANTRTAKDGEEIYFSADISGGFAPYSYEWALGDGAKSTESEALHAYKKAGKYTIALTVTDDKGNKVTRTRENYITVIPGWSAGNIASSAWSGLVSFGRGLSSIIIWLGVFLPVWIALGLIAWGVIWYRRRQKKA